MKPQSPNSVPYVSGCANLVEDADRSGADLASQSNSSTPQEHGALATRIIERNDILCADWRSRCCFQSSPHCEGPYGAKPVDRRWAAPRRATGPRCRSPRRAPDGDTFGFPCQHVAPTRPGRTTPASTNVASCCCADVSALNTRQRRRYRCYARPARDVFADYPHAIYLPPRHRVPRHAAEANRARGRARAGRRRPAFEARVIRPEDCGFEIRGGGNATRQIVDIMPPDRSSRSPAGLRGVHAGRQLVQLSAAQARHRSPAGRSRARGDLLLPVRRPGRVRIPAAVRHDGTTARSRSARRRGADSRDITRLLQRTGITPIT